MQKGIGMIQPDLFDLVADAYGQHGDLDNHRLYREVATRAGLAEALGKKVPIGNARRMHDPLKRKIRWYQQDLKRLGLIEHVPGKRGVWQLTEGGKHKLRKIKPDAALLAFSTDLGIAIWGSCDRVFTRLESGIALNITSVPYPLKKARAYGNPTPAEFVDFICKSMEPIVKRLIPGGSICINVSNDIFEYNSPARSLYRERMVIALHERLGLYKMDEIIWENPSKPPSPVQWASIKRVQLNAGWEPIYWFTNDPYNVRADNRRVLEPHTERHLGLIRGGGERRIASYSDGSYRIRIGSFSYQTEGRIPRNVIRRGHHCPDQVIYKAKARSLGLKPHGAPFPLAIVNFLIRFLTEPMELVVDQFGGSLSTAKESEILGRRWVTTDNVYDYVRGGAERFRDFPGFWLNPDFEERIQ